MAINSDLGCLPRGLAMVMAKAKAPSRLSFPSRVQYLSLLISVSGVVDIEPHHHSSSIFLQSIFARTLPSDSRRDLCVGGRFVADGSPS